MGGNALNVSIGLARLGSSVALVGKVGQDPDGAYLLEVLTSEGVDISRVIVDSSYHTAQCYCLTGLDGEHSFFNWPAPNAAQMLNADEITGDTFGSAFLLHATGISFTSGSRLQAVKKAILQAHAAGMIVSFDAGWPGSHDGQARQSIDSVLSCAHIIKVNYPELLFWSGGAPEEAPDRAARRLHERRKPVALVATLGARGALVVTEKNAIYCPPFTVREINGIGAGDAFVAAMLHYLTVFKKCRSVENLAALSEAEWLSAGTFANAAGALATTTVSASEGLPRLSQVYDLISSQPPEGLAEINTELA